MPATRIPSQQILDGGIQRADLCVNGIAGTNVVAKLVQGAGISLNSTGNDAGTGDVTISATGGVAGVSSFNTRTGAVVPAINDYSFAQLSGAASVAQLPISSDFGFTNSQTINLTNANATTDDSVLTLRHRCSATPAAGFGTCIWMVGNSASAADRDMAQIYTAWSVATDASRTSYMGFRLISAASTFAERMRLHGSGGLAIGTTNLQTDPGANFLNVPTGGGYKINGVVSNVPSGGTAGQSLVKNTSNPFDMAWDTFASAQSPATTTAGTVSTAGVHAGLGATSGATFTPAVTGRVLVVISGYLSSSLAGAWAALTAYRYGTGTPPAHGAAPTGSTVPAGSAALGHSGSANFGVPFSVSFVLSGLTVGSTYWVDPIYATSGATSTAKLNTAAMSIVEF